MAFETKASEEVSLIFSVARAWRESPELTERIEAVKQACPFVTEPEFLSRFPHALAFAERIERSAALLDRTGARTQYLKEGLITSGVDYLRKLYEQNPKILKLYARQQRSEGTRGN